MSGKEETNLRLGTSSWTGDGWEKTFYPKGTAPRDYLAHYATKFDTVEVDSTFYRIPSPSMVKRWRDVTPDGFTFAAKVPHAITHDKVLVDAEGELREFVRVMDLLGDRLGPLLLQFPYFNKKAFATVDDFLARLGPFVKKLPKDRRWAVEIRNKSWLGPKLLDVLRDRGVALAWIDHPWMPRPAFYGNGKAYETGDFAYIRWLGDRYKIEETTKVWDRIILDRAREMEEWVPLVRGIARRRTVYGYFNNHYAGHAPGSIALFLEVWRRSAGAVMRPSSPRRSR